ncbi:MAG: response regulator [Desulfobacteraceae bacterium]|nr:response regulator [Desulfobacteraceae bacterium]MBC2757708.1 response regulator [Desulfobacteraceae bacterium]
MIKRLVLVEDNPVTHQIFQEILFDWVVIPVFTAQKAETFLHEEQDFNGVVVMIDLSVIKENGIEWITKIRAAYSDVPVIILSGTEDDAMLKAIKETVVNDCIIRPFYGEVLVNAVENAIEV